MGVVLITGANSGMGYETALALGKNGHSINFTARSREKADLTEKRLFTDSGGLIKARGFVMDLESLASVRTCALEIKKELRSIDCLILNAGIMTPPWRLTTDGYESQFQANYLGHFLFSHHLLDNVLSSGGKKLISISSLSGEKGINRTIADFEKTSRVPKESYNAMRCYRESKLAQVLFTLEADARYGSKGLTAGAVHPGVVNTGLFYRGTHPVLKALIQPAAWLGYATGMLTTPRRGARTAVYLAGADSIPGGKYWADCKKRAHNPIADDTAFRSAFWEWSTGLISKYQ